MSLERLPPATFVELADVVAGGRKLVLVDETGVGYFDLLADGELPKPLRVELMPTPLGTIQAWLNGMEPERAQAMAQAWQELIDRQNDVLTIARAIRWGVLHDNVDTQLLEEIGVSQTELIRQGRNRLADALK